jgi:hypothetical protein
MTRRRSRAGLLVTVLAALLAVFAPAAGATQGILNFDDVYLGVGAPPGANLAIPNADFELPCPGATCGWFAEANSTLASDGSKNHTPGGATSLRMTLVASSAIQGGCFTLSPSTLYNESVFYATLGPPTFSLVFFHPSFYATADCNGFISSPLLSTSSPTADGSFHELAGTVTSPASAHSAHLELGANCSGCSTPTSAVLRSLEARTSGGGVLVRWRTATEMGTLGFNVYRGDVRLNHALIPSVFGGTARGHGYSWLDRTAGGVAARYRLQAVGIDGSRSWLGSARAART